VSAGSVAIVGAGPGDPRLITVRGLQLLRSADVVVHERLVDSRLLDEAPPHAVRIFAGKETGHHAIPQEEINALLVTWARRGRRVVRLKGGDPFVFGRGAEEVAALATAGVPLEVVPGVSSAIAVPEAAGIPVTCRGIASSVAIVTGHREGSDPGGGAEGEPTMRCGDGPTVDWSRLATAADTLVILMGLGNLGAIARALIAAGRPADTPVALVRAGTTAEQETVVGTLGDIEGRAVEARLEAPVVIVVGQVVALRERLCGLATAVHRSRAPRLRSERRRSLRVV
jgi:uroporphyrinogen III methyltransferase/synthase